MKTKFKKLGVLAAVFALVMAMSVPAFAETYTSGSPSVTTDTTLNIPKTLIVSNPDLASVAGPGLTYSYALASVTPAAANGGTTITDKDTPTSHTGNVHAGPADGVDLTTASVGWAANEACTASPSGTANTKNIVAEVDLTKFSAPGIYRYSITESASATPATKGVVDANAAEVRYLDVYIERGSNDAFIVKGYVVHDGATTSGAPSNKATFDSSSFETFNITLNKQVTGSMGDRNNQFPFAGTITDGGRYFYAKKGSAPTAVDGNKIAGGATSAVSTTLAHGETYYISGLSDVATVTYTETNNTPDTYKTAITGVTGITNGEASDVAASGTKGFSDAVDADDAAAATVFTNNFDSVSPTGVVLRYGPYIGMLAIAAALFIFIRKRTSEDAE